MEPRLLLSVTLGSTPAGVVASAATIATNIAAEFEHLGHILGQSSQDLGDFGHALPLAATNNGAAQSLLSLTDSAGKHLFDLNRLIQDDIVAPLTNAASTIGAAANTADLANAMQTAINARITADFPTILGIGTPHVTVVDNSTETKISDGHGGETITGADAKFDFMLSVPMGQQTLTFDLGGKDGLSIHTPVSGKATITETLHLSTDIDIFTAPSAPTGIIQSASIDTALSVAATFPQMSMDYGLLALTTTGAATLSYNATITQTLAAATSDATLTSDDHPNAPLGTLFTTTHTSPSSTILDVPLVLTAGMEAIPGITVAANASLTATGDLFDGVQVSLNNMGSASDFLNVTPNGLYNLLASLGADIDNLTKSSLMDVAIPFTNGTTIGDVTNFTSNFTLDVLNKLGPVDTLLNIKGQAATAADLTQAAAVTIFPTIDLSTNPLPGLFQIDINVDGQRYDLTISNPNTITSMATLKSAIDTALGAALAATPLPGTETITTSLVASDNSAGNKFGGITFTVAGDGVHPASVSLTTPGASFLDLEQFAKNLAQALGVGNVDQSVADLVNSTGLKFDQASHSIVFDLNYLANLPIINNLTFSTGLDLGEIAGLSGSGTLSLAASAGANMTIGVSLAALGTGVTVDGHSVTDAAAFANAVLSDLPVWPTGTAATTVTADQIAGTTGLPDIKIYLRDGHIGTIEFTPGDATHAQTLHVVAADGTTHTVTGNGTSASGATGQITIGNLLEAINDVDPKLSAVYDDQNLRIAITDTDAPPAGPQNVGFQLNAIAAAQQLTGGAHNGEYQAVIDALVPSPPDKPPYDYTQAMSFVLTLGTLDPVTITLAQDATRTTIDAMVTAINHALGDTHNSALQIDPTKLGLLPGTGIQLSTLIVAAKDLTTGDLLLETTMYNAVSAIPTNPNGATAAEQAAAQFGLALGAVEYGPQDIGFANNQGVSAVQISAGPNVHYQAVLDASVPAAPNTAFEYTQQIDFVLTLGTLDPIPVSLAADSSRNTIDEVVAAINHALQDPSLAVDPTKLGLPSGTAIPLSELITALKGANGHLQLETTMYNAVSSDPASATSAERAAAKFGLAISAVDLKVWATNGSQLVSVLGLGGADVNLPSDPTGVVVGGPLHGQTLADRFFINDANLVASVDLTMSGLSLSGQLGFLNFSASGHGEVSLATTLALQSPSGGTHLTLHQIGDAFTDGTLSNLWTFTVGAGTPGQPWAELVIDHVAVAGGAGIGLDTSAVEFTISFSEPLTDLAAFLAATPKVSISGFDAVSDLSHLQFSDIISGILKVFDILNDQTSGSIFNQDIPLIHVNVGTLIDAAHQFATYVADLQAHPTAALDQMTQVIQNALGTTAISLQIDSSNNLILAFHLTGFSTHQQLPINLDLAAINSSLPSFITSLVGTSATGTLDVTASAVLAVTLGIRLGPVPATTASAIADLNKGQGIKTDGTSAPDLQFTLADGRTFSVNLDGSTSVQQIITAINSAAPADSHFGASLDANGKLIFSDPTAVFADAPAGLSGLGYTGANPHPSAVDNSTNLVLTTPATDIDVTKEYAFSLVINGHAVQVDVAADATRTTAADFANAIDHVLGTTLVDKSALGIAGSGKVSLGHLVTVSGAGTGSSETLTFVASDAALHPATGSASFALKDTGIQGLNALGFAGTHPTVTATDDSTNSVIATTLPAGIDVTGEYRFNVVINGHPVTVDVPADGTRANAADLASAINQALTDTTIDPSVLGIAGSDPVTLHSLVTVAESHSGGIETFTFTASDSAITPQGGGPPLFELQDAGNVVGTFKVVDLHNSGSLESLGFTVASAQETSAGTRTVAGTELDTADNQDRFFVKTASPSDTGLVVSLGIDGEHLNFNTSFGPIAISIVDGHAIVGAETDPTLAAGNDHFAVSGPATATIGVDQGANAGQLLFTEIAAATSLSSLVHFSSNVAIDVDLPLSVLGIPVGHLTVTMADVLDTDAAHPFTSHLTAPDWDAAFDEFFNNQLAFLNSPQAVINGLDAMLGTMDTLFQNQVFGFQLPLIGGALADAGDFIKELRFNTVGYLQGFVDDYEAIHNGQQPTTVDIIASGFSQLLTHTLGFTSSTSGDAVTGAVNMDTRTVVFDAQFQRTLLTESVNLTSDLGIPGLGIAINNGAVTLSLTLFMNFQFGFNADTGFFLIDSAPGQHALDLHFSVAPAANFDISATLGILTVDAANGPTTGTSLTGDVFVNLHPDGAANLADIGFTAQSLAGVNDGTHTVVTAAQPLALTNNAIAFQVVIDGTATTINVAANTRANIGALVHDIDTALGAANLGVHADLDAGKLRLTIADSALGANPSFSVQDVPITLTKIPSSVQVEIKSSLDLDLQLSANVSLGSAIELPKVSAELVFGYGLDHVLAGYDSGTEVNGVTTPLEFKNIELDVGAFLTGFLGPILDYASTVTAPLIPILDFLTAPLPGVSDILGQPTSLLDIARKLGGDNPEIQSIVNAVNMIDQVAHLVQTIHDLSSVQGGNIIISFGNFTPGGGFDPFSASLKSVDLSTDTQTPTHDPASGAAAQKQQDALNQLNSLSGGGLNQTAGSISLPILQSPLGALKLLTGQVEQLDLFLWTLPSFTFSFSNTEHFPLVGFPGINIGADLGVHINAAMNLTIGYDTSGIIEFISSHNPVLLIDGFFIQDLVPQLTLNVGVSAGASLDLTLVRAGLTGEIDGNFALMLNDPNNDGRVRLSEMLTELESNPLSIFNIKGDITAKIFGWWWVGVDLSILGTITLYEGSWDILNATLVSFDTTPPPKTILSSVDSNHTLTIDSGPLAGQRSAATAIDKSDDNETFTIRHVSGLAGNEVISVSYTDQQGHTYTQTDNASGVAKINIDGGIGNNTIIVDGVLSPIVVNGKDGSNIVTLDAATTGDATIQLGNGNNIVTGGSGKDTITLGNGNNTVYGGANDDTITVAAGANLIVGGGGSDTITAGSGNNTIIGDGPNAAGGTAATGGNNIIKAGGGNNIVFGGTANTISATTLSATSTQDGSNTITLGDGKNVVFGGSGSDIITVGSNNDIVIADIGTITYDTHGALISAVATSATGGADTVTVGDGDMIVIGGAGNDTLTGGNGTNVILGDDGSVAGPAGGSGGTFTITATNFATGDDTILGGVNNDVLLGGPGRDTITGLPGQDIIAGDDAIVVRNTFALGRQSVLVSITSSDESSGDNDHLDGGVGNDVILGGAGADYIDGGSGNNTLFGDFGTYTPHPALATTPDAVGQDAGLAANGRDTILAADGYNVIMGGGDNDTITVGNGIDVIFGDNGEVVRDRVTLKPLSAGSAGLPDENSGGDDTITAGLGINVVFGGAGIDTIGATAGTNVLLGDFGTFTEGNTTDPHNPVPDVIVGTDTNLLINGVLASGADIFNITGGTNVIMGGGNADAITANGGINTIFGDSGEVHRDTVTFAMITAFTADESFGGDDHVILGGTANNVVLGGAGADIVDIQGTGSNVVLGDLGIVNAVDGINPDVIAHNLGVGGIDTITVTLTATGNNVIMGGDGGDIINVNGSGNNIVFGDGGKVTRAAGTLALIAADTDNSAGVATNEEVTGGADAIIVNGAGRNVLFGGAGQDNITIHGTGINIALGDVGLVTPADGVHPDVTTHNPTVGDIDTILVASDASGNNVVMGGAGADLITITGNGGNVVFGDSGDVVRAAATLDLLRAETINETSGAADIIIVNGDGNNVVLGGVDGDTITVNGIGDNVLLGDVGYVTAIDGINPDIVAHNTTIGAADFITIAATAAGSNIVIGSAGADQIEIAGNGNNIVFGDSGEVTRAPATRALITARTVEETLGAADTVTIDGSGNNVVLGGAGADIFAINGTGDNIVLGDMGAVNAIDGINPDVVGLDTTLGAAEQITLSSTATGNNIIMGETGDDVITSAGPGINTLLGDSGSVTRDPATRLPILIQSTEPTLGGNDTITATAGTNYAIGGFGIDNIHTAAGNDVLIGDNGLITLSGGILTKAASTDPTVGGDDTLDAGSGNNVVIGGFGNDRLTAGNGNDFVIGDNGMVLLSGGLPTAMASSDPSTGGNDTIDAGNGLNYIIGGSGSDDIRGGSGSDFVLGDNGAITFTAGVPVSMISTDFAFGAGDTIRTGDGTNYVIGGTGADTITGGSGRDQLIGDQGAIYWNTDGTLKEITSLLDVTGGNDSITGGDGDDNIIGGLGDDALVGGVGNDIIIGDDGHILFDHGREIMVETLDQFVGGNDVVDAGPGFNFLFGGFGSNFFFANPLTDLIVGGNGHADIDGNRQVVLALPPFLGDGMLTPLGSTLLTPFDLPDFNQVSVVSGSPTALDVTTGVQAGLFLHALDGSALSGFNLPGLLSEYAVGASLANILAIGSSSLIKSVTFGNGDEGEGAATTSEAGTSDNVVAFIDPPSQDAIEVATPDYDVPAPAYHGTRFTHDIAPNAETDASAADLAFVFDDETGHWIVDSDHARRPQLTLDAAAVPELTVSRESRLAA